MLHNKSKRHRKCSMQRLGQRHVHSCKRQLLQIIQALFVFTEDSHQWPCTSDIGSTRVKASNLQSVHDQVVQVLLVRQEVAELPGHQLLHTCFLSADEALNHHTAGEHSSSAHVGRQECPPHACRHSVAAFRVDVVDSKAHNRARAYQTCCHRLTSSCSKLSNMNRCWAYEDIT